MKQGRDDSNLSTKLVPAQKSIFQCLVLRIWHSSVLPMNSIMLLHLGLGHVPCSITVMLAAETLSLTGMPMQGEKQNENLAAVTFNRYDPVTQF